MLKDLTRRLDCVISPPAWGDVGYSVPEAYVSEALGLAVAATAILCRAVCSEFAERLCLELHTASFELRNLLSRLPAR